MQGGLRPWRQKATADARPFSIAVDDAVLADLRDRLSRTRWPVAPDGPDWAFGASAPYLRRVVDHWLGAYDWRAWEARLNATPQFQVEVEGADIHCLVERGSGADQTPLLLLHGWPGSVAEFLPVIEPLAHPERFDGNADDGFTVIAPSLPGFGFSAAPSEPQSNRETARRLVAMMATLGYPRFVVHGGDMGANIASWMAIDAPDSVVAMHLTLASLRRPVAASEQLPAEVVAWQARAAARLDGETAYQQIMGSKPATLAFALTDSPIGLAAWILEKFHGWTTPGQEGDPPLALDHLITNIMLYWLAGPASACWPYRFYLDGSGRTLEAGPGVEVPTAFLLFPEDIATPPPRDWIERAYRVSRYRIADRGGHFPALEQPDVLVADIRSFLVQYRC
jgi:pimeloyl-ACP methyl ester carboxylesterase